MQNEARPIVVKRKKVVKGGGHHGGAWKVAYADFVTAMMAFFMLMWLMGATTESQRKGLADYFGPSLPISASAGGTDSPFGGKDALSEGFLIDSDPNEGAKADAQEGDALEAVRDALSAGGPDGIFAHIRTRMTDEGLVLDLVDLPGAPLFDPHGVPTAVLIDLAAALAEGARLVRNDIAVEGGAPDGGALRDGQERAATLDRLMLEHGLTPRRTARITGHRAGARPPVSVIFLTGGFSDER